MEKPMNRGGSDVILFRRSRLLFEFLVFLAGWVALDAALRLLRLGQPTAPRLLQAVFAVLAGTMKRNASVGITKNKLTALIN